MRARSVLSASPRHGQRKPFGASPPARIAAEKAEARGEFSERVRTSPILILMLVLMMLVPVELSIRAGPVFMPWYRAVLFLAAAWVFVRSFGLHFASFDYLILAHAFWRGLCEMIKNGTAGLEPTGSYIVETVVIYLMARLTLTRPGHFTALPRLFFIIMIIPILLAIPEAMILKTQFVHNFAFHLTGYWYRFDSEFRLGILRAASTFEHPILFGLFCSIPISLIWVTVKNRLTSLAMIAVLCGGVFLSASSAPILLTIIQFVLLIGERLTRGISGRFRLVMWFCVLAFIFVSVASDRGPFVIIAQELALNSGSGYTRVLIWQFGIDDVMSNPIFGIRPEEWTRPSWLAPSVDNNWLLLAMQAGLPGIFFLFAAMALIWRRLYRTHRASAEFDRLRFGWSCVMVALFLAGATVAYFGKMLPFFFLLLGYGAALAHLGTRPSASSEGQAEADARAGSPGVLPSEAKRRTYL